MFLFWIAQYGTSFSSPHVAGAVARFLSLYPSASAADVRNSLICESTLGIVSGNVGATPNQLLYIPPTNLPYVASGTACTNKTCSRCSVKLTHVWEQQMCALYCTSPGVHI